MNKHYEKWDEFAPRSLMLIGLGMSFIGNAIQARTEGRGFFSWFLRGTLGLVALNSGISMFGEAVKERTLYELDVKALREADEAAAAEDAS